jgi:hypothetical protein
MIESIELPAKTNTANWRTEAPARASVPEWFKCGKGGAYPEPGHLRDQFI